MLYVFQKKIKIISFCLGLIVALSACGHMPVTSMVKLRKFDPATTDIEKLSVAVSVDDTMMQGEKGVRMIIIAESLDGAQTHQDEFVLSNSLRADDLALLINLRQPRRKLYAYRINPEDLERLEVARSRMRPVNGEKKWKGSLSIAADVCRKTDIVPEKILVSTYIKSEETQEYVPFLVDVDVLKEVKDKSIDDVAPICQNSL